MSGRAPQPRLRPTGGFIFRTPVMPFATLANLGGDRPRPASDVRRDLVGLLEDPLVREAVFVASPERDAQIDAWRGAPDAPDGQGVERALVRYVSRMAGRATPFGLFSGVSTGELGATTRLEIGAAHTLRRHTRLDNDYLFAACAALASDPALRRELPFLPNSSLYRAANRYHYAEARLDGGGRSYHLVAVDPTDYLDQILARAHTGATLGELGEVLCSDPEISGEEADAYLAELVDAQILVPALAPAVTGRQPTEHVIEVLQGLPAGRAFAAVLGEAQARIRAIDATPPGAPTDPYRDIAASLAGGIPARAELARMFQVDLFRPAPAASLGPKVVAALVESVSLLATVGGSSGDDETWSKFRQAFAARYETREVPLLEVLDEETGIGFGAPASAGAAAPLLAALAFPGRAADRRVPWNRRDSHLLGLVTRAVREGALEIALSDHDLECLERPPAKLPDTFSIHCALAAESADAVDEGRFLLKVVGIDAGPGARLLGRFCHGSSEVTAIAAASIQAEQALRPEASFAEIVHLPEGRVGNILLRPVLREYEIPYLGTSGAARDRQLPVSDLMVSIAGELVVVRSRRLDRQLIPRLTSAHNYTARSLNVYRFLCALGQQYGSGVGWSWGALAEAPFLPRVRHGQLVLSRVRWLLSELDLAPLAAAARGAKAATTAAARRAIDEREQAAVAALRDRLRLPRWIVVTDADNELPVDLDNPLSVTSLVHLIKNRRSAVIHELFPAPDQLVARGPAGGFVHELVVPFARVATAEEIALRAAPPRSSDANSDRAASMRRLPPGSRWLYVKLYAGVAAIDQLLRDVVAPAVDGLRADRLIERWFFIRYGDPDWHLRLRFEGDPATLMREVLPRLQALVAPQLERGLIWRVQVDTYERELERYGGPAGIELAEQLFCADSDCVLDIVRAAEGAERADAIWRLTLRGIDRLLADLGFATGERLALLTRARDNFAAEFNVDTAFQRRLGETFRRVRADVEAVLTADAADPEHPLGPGLVAIERRSETLRPIARALHAAEAQLTSSRGELALSFVHMHVNRITSIEARSQELVLYDVLRRHYQGALARTRGSAPAS